MPSNDVSFNICGTGLKLFHLNTRSLLPKIDEIRSFSCLLKQEASIFGFTETHLSPDILNGEIAIPGYNLFRHDRYSGYGGGVAIYTSNTLNCARMYGLESDNIESLWIQIIQPNTSSILACILYRPPQMLIEWYNHFESQLEKAYLVSHKIIVMGDTNIDFLKAIPQRWLEVIHSYDFTQIINSPTRVSNSSVTLIDHIYVSKPQHVVESKVFTVTISDHYGIGVCWKITKSLLKREGDHVPVKYRKIIVDNVENELSVLKSNMNKVTASGCLDDKVDVFYSALNKFIEKTSVCIERRVRKPIQPPWFSKEIYTAIGLRNHYKTSNMFEEYRIQ